MTPYRFLALSLCATLAACAQQPPHEEAGAPGADGAQALPRVVTAKPDARKLPLPDVELNEELLYKLMLAEIAVQRGQPHVAVPAYLELARDTRDPRIAQRATEVAWNARFQSAALEAATIWLQVDPKSTRARQIIAALLVNQAKLAEAQPHLEEWLAADRENVGRSFLQLNVLLARHKDKPGVLQLMRGLAAQYPDVPEARLAVAQAAWNAKDEQLALKEARAALKFRPDWEIAALFVAQVLQRRSDDEAIQYLGGYLEAYPKARDVRLNYVRLLVNVKRYAEARQQFEVLVREYPQNAEVSMAVALLAVQAKDYDAAEAQLKRVLELDYKDPDAARLYLGQVNEERQRFDAALKWYSSVNPGGQYINAQGRYAGVLAKQGKLAEARQHLQQVTAHSNRERVQLTQAEAQLLREANAYQEAFDVLGRALEKMPNTPDLLYDYAMAAEKVDRIDVVEANLRKLIKIQPDHAHAYNALGYTLADRNQRVEEAHDLIRAALKLSPDDPFIMDSMGWVLYRMGRSEEGLEYLQRAYRQRPDAEIAAHLGEVLWALGRREEARRIWDGALKDHPKNEALQKAVKRFLP
ncbi:MAG: tetratricopeptide repeat protein [Betaproteobacteria bacterium]|nr:tetratricopeptide repeat protein [Betaproteobacteria bacterium]MDH3436068.1 tetratricopeptide repeat protein [Betaproteobacteria bacterium]